MHFKRELVFFALLCSWLSSGAESMLDHTMLTVSHLGPQDSVELTREFPISTSQNAKLSLMRELARISRENKKQQQAHEKASANSTAEVTNRKRKRRLRIRATAIHVDKAEFPLGRLLFKLSLQLALTDANKYLARQQQQQQKSTNSSNGGGGGFDQVELALSVRSANTCSRQFAGAIAAEEYYLRRARLFIVSGCDDAIRGVSRMASQWRVPIMTAAGFGADLSDKRVHRSLVRVAFSLRAAVEFLFKIMRMFQWNHVNLVVDESDANSLALKNSIEKHLADYQAVNSSNVSVALNTIVFDLESLLVFKDDSSNSSSLERDQDEPTKRRRRQQQRRDQSDDKWPNEITEQAIDDTLWRCSRYSRVTIVLMGQRHLRKFMLSAYDRNMANGHYAFINMPLLLMDDRLGEVQEEEEAARMAAELNASTTKLTGEGGGGSERGGPGGSVSSEQQHYHQQQQQQRPISSGNTPAGPAATGENEFIWRSPQLGARNAQAKQAFESLMSIYLRTPTTKAYVYFANNLNSLANSNYAASMVAPLAGRNSTNLWSKEPEVRRRLASTTSQGRRIKLNTNPYSASFYDSLLIYARALHESLQLASPDTGKDLSVSADGTRSRSMKNQHSLEQTHARVSELIWNRRFENMITGSVFINKNGDRETDFTLDDMNPMTGKFAPVILYRGDTRETQRLGRIHWSSVDSSAGPTEDSVDCNLLGNCYSSRLALAKTILWLALLAGPVAILMGLFYFVHSRLKLESQLLDYWWRIHLSEIEIVKTWRRKAADGSLVMTASHDGSMVSSGGHSHVKEGKTSVVMSATNRITSKLTSSRGGSESGPAADKTDVTRATDTSNAWAQSAVDVCYGNITIGIFRLSKVALKPINKFHQSRKLMIELRGVSVNHHRMTQFFAGEVVEWVLDRFHNHTNLTLWPPPHITYFFFYPELLLEKLKELNHTNLCRFIGIVVDEGSLAIVSEFCPKGSLHEFFQNESMVIDWTFKYSIINDIVAGLKFLHSSPLGFHGRLKSSNCLVSGRFVIKLSDYGPHTLLEQQDQDEGGGSHETNWFRKRIWLAPEHMASSRRTSGSMMGDVYSFGLVLYEIITNCMPFFNVDQNDFVMPVEKLYEGLRSSGPSDELGPDMSLIEQLIGEAAKKASLPAPGPLQQQQQQTTQGTQAARTTSVSTDQAIQANVCQAPATIGPLVDLMKACWRFEPNKRPSLVEVNSALRKLTRGVTSGKLLENLTKRMEQYTNNLESLVEAKLATLMEEKFKTEELLYQFVPKSIASLLREGHFVEPEAFECVTVFYSDIVGFTSLSSESSPMEVVDFLSELYLCFDETLEQHDIFKVDTIGDAYIVASGLPQPNDGKHVIEIAHTALELRDRLKRFKIPHKPGRSLEMRVGIHSGPCVAGIVGGLNMPKYCVFGDTLTIGKFMESSGLPMKIHITEESRQLLIGVQEFHIEPRQPRITRDGLPYQTYWLERGVERRGVE